ncbi:MAG TPA: Gfo/Idh/MocA family oxidoreductase, partial [Bacteroidetes bacterium]|nr:Gfo/Idh/MocA family oxidoreductase [Bacteroidota bacterium]
MKDEKSTLNRRQFLGTATAAGAIGAVGIGAMMNSCGKPAVDLKLPPLLDVAPDGPELTAGLVGCGGRGTGAAAQFLSAGPNLKIIALADVFRDRLDSCRQRLTDKPGFEVTNENCFIGFDAYRKLIDSGVDVVLLATPPHFRPEHFAAAIKARKHVFMEKPVAVDPVGARSVMSTAKKADAAGLSVVTGTQRRHQRDYIETFKRVAGGEIGEIVSANCYWNGGQLWYKTQQSGWSDMEYMIRDWVNWCWLSGDHIVEQHVHNLDVINWFTGKHPVKTVGFGGRHRRVTGDQYDFFSVDYVFDDSKHLHSMCRQIDGCANNVSEFIMGTKGHSNCRNTIWKPDGSVRWNYPYLKDDKGKTHLKVGPYFQEHIDLVTAIRTNKPVDYAENTAISTLVA